MNNISLLCEFRKIYFTYYLWSTMIRQKVDNSLYSRNMQVINNIFPQKFSRLTDKPTLLHLTFPIIAYLFFDTICSFIRNVIKNGCEVNKKSRNVLQTSDAAYSNFETVIMKSFNTDRYFKLVLKNYWWQLYNRNVIFSYLFNCLSYSDVKYLKWNIWRPAVRESKRIR